MSLISDALKEAENKKKDGPEGVPEYMQSALNRKSNPRGKLIGALVVAILIFAVIVGGTFFFMKYKDSGKLKQVAETKPAAPVAQPPAQPQPQPQQQASAKTESAAKKTESPASEKPKPLSEADQFKDPFGTSSGGSFDTISPYQLKAIFFDETNPKNSSAIVNNSIVKRGDSLTGGAKVIDIKRESITVKLQGKKIKLTLP